MIKIIVEHHIDTTKRGADFLFDKNRVRIVKTYVFGILVMNRITNYTSTVVKDNANSNSTKIGFNNEADA